MKVSVGQEVLFRRLNGVLDRGIIEKINHEEHSVLVRSKETGVLVHRQIVNLRRPKEGTNKGGETMTISSTLGQSKPKRKLEVYEFTAQALPAIDNNKLMEDLSYKNPMLIAEFGGKFYALIHPSVYNKAAWTEDENLIAEVEAKIGWFRACLFEIQQDEIQSIKLLVKKVLDADWSKSAKEFGTGKVRVTVLNF